MQKLFFMLFLIALSFLWVSPSFSEKSISEAEKPAGMEVYNREGKSVGIVKKIDGKLVFFDSEVVTFKKHHKDEWGIYNVKDVLVGKLTRKKDHLSLISKQGKFTGFLLYVKDRRPRELGNNTAAGDPTLKDEFEYVSTVTQSLKIEPEAAELYHNVLKAFE